MVLDLQAVSIALFVLLALIIVLGEWIFILYRKITALTRGKNGASLETVITALAKDTQELQASRSEIETYLANVEKRLRRSVQGVSLIRFNPFDKSAGGGNQSFSVGIINENGDGIVISSIYSRERVNTYAKSVTKFDSKYELTDEEKQALKEARPKQVSL